MILSIDTSTDEYKFMLFAPDGKAKEFSAKRDDNKDALFFIDQLLKKNKVKVKDLKAIAVFQGPGSYTGLRVGISIANVLAFALEIPAVGFKTEKPPFEKILAKLKKGELAIGTIVRPVYEFNK